MVRSSVLIVSPGPHDRGKAANQTPSVAGKMALSHGAIGQAYDYLPCG